MESLICANARTFRGRGARLHCHGMLLAQARPRVSWFGLTCATGQQFVDHHALTYNVLVVLLLVVLLLLLYCCCCCTQDTGMANVPGSNDVVICYDKNGHAWAPDSGDGDRSAVFTVRVTIERVVEQVTERLSP